ncbi:MAG: ABC transporter ATP-binding protein, partial [Myxococcales bacterium]|nr:ABC transporter ATP-binding protein [Myxococcales bacterium]
MAALDQVQIRKVAKRYGSERALAGVTLDLTAGSMCALLGHNGAGKTTLLGVVSTLVRPTGGTVAYHSKGGAVVGGEVRREIGMLAHTSLCYADLSARENLELTAGLYDIAASATVIDGMLDRVGLERKARDRAARTYSRGMLQRLALARALLT